jgi:hypothetical protein
MVLAVKHFQKPLPVHPRWEHVELYGEDVVKSISMEDEEEQY